MKRPIIAFLMLGVVLRLGIVLAGVHYDQDPSFFDVRDYDQYAQNLLSGKGLTNGKAWASRPPLYPLILAGSYALFGISHLPVRIFQCLLDTLTILLVYLIGRRYFQRNALQIGVFLCVIHPILILYCGNILTETTSCFLLALLSWVLIRSGETGLRPWPIFLAGMLYGGLLLTKASLVFFFPFLIGWFLFKRIPIRTLIVFCIALGVTLSPWILRNYRVLGEFVPLTTNGGTTYWMAHNPQTAFDPAHQGLAIGWIMPGRVMVERQGETVLLGEVEGDRYLWKKGLLFTRGLVTERPGLFVWLLLKKFLAAFSLHAGKKGWELVGYGSLYALAFLGMLLRVRHKPRPVLLYLIVFQYIATILIFWGRAKYRVVIEPYLMLFVGVALAQLFEKLKRARS